MNFETWLRTWLRRHPLKEPAQAHRARYTAEVMAKIKALASEVAPQRAWVWRWSQPAFAAVAAALVVLVVTHSNSSPRLAQEVSREAQVLSALDEDGLEPLNDDAELADLLLLAESTPSDEQWIEHTAQLLDQLDDEASADHSGDEPSSDQEWLDELQLLDESDHATSS